VNGFTPSVVVNEDFGFAISGKYDRPGSVNDKLFVGTITSPVLGNTPTFNDDASRVNTKFNFVGAGLGAVAFSGSATVKE